MKPVKRTASLKELVSALGVTYSAVYYWHKYRPNNAPPFEYNGKRRRYNMEECKTWHQSRKTNPNKYAMAKYQTERAIPQPRQVLVTPNDFAKLCNVAPRAIREWNKKAIGAPKLAINK
jgi:DNA-binding transcriptional MerR regulator